MESGSKSMRTQLSSPPSLYTRSYRVQWLSEAEYKGHEYKGVRTKEEEKRCQLHVDTTDKGKRIKGESIKETEWGHAPMEKVTIGVRTKRGIKEKRK